MAFGFAHQSTMPALAQRLQGLQQSGQQLSQAYPAWGGIPGSPAGGGAPQGASMSLPDAWNGIKSAASKIGIGGSSGAPQSSPFDSAVSVGGGQLGGSMPDDINLSGWGNYAQAAPQVATAASAAPATAGTAGSIAHYLAALFGG